jgi:hypothetical protein
LRPRKRLRGQAKPSAQFGSDALGMAKRRLHPPGRGANAWVAKLDSVARERPQSPPQRRERGVVSHEQVKQFFKVVRPWHDEGEFFQQRLEEFFRRLERMNRVPPLSHLITCHRLHQQVRPSHFSFLRRDRRVLFPLGSASSVGRRLGVVSADGHGVLGYVLP